MSISLDQIKALRDKTGVSITACKKALEEANGDEAKAVELLRKKGEAKAAAREDRSTHEGVIAYSANDSKVVIMKLLCETDFVAKNSDFVDAANGLAKLLLDGGIDKDISSEVSDLSLKMGEKLVIDTVKEVEGSNLGVYVHSNNKLGAVVSLEGTDAGVAKQVAMHVTAANPTALNPEDVEQSLVDAEHTIWNDELAKSGKPEAMFEKILAGKEAKFRNAQALTHQDFVIDPSQKVQQYVESKGGSIISYVNLRV